MTDIITKLIDEIGPGHMASTAYDTAWAARLGDVDWALSSRSLAWLAENQLPDGSWGAPAPMYYHDRVICTLAAMIALSYQGRRGHDRTQIENGRKLVTKPARMPPAISGTTMRVTVRRPVAPCICAASSIETCTC